MDIDVDRLIDGMEGIVYVTDARGSIVAIGNGNWNRFAFENDGAGLVDGNDVIGRSIFDFIEGDEVRATYRRFFDAILAGKSRRARLLTRCDSPAVKRELWIFITPIHGERGIEHLLVQSLTIFEEARPPIDLFKFNVLLDKLCLAKNLPILTMCSYCQNVRSPSDSSESDGIWVAAEIYYQRGGDSNVRISHGICPSCEAKVAAAFVNGLLVGV